MVIRVNSRGADLHGRAFGGMRSLDDPRKWTQTELQTSKKWMSQRLPQWPPQASHSRLSQPLRRIIQRLFGARGQARPRGCTKHGCPMPIIMPIGVPSQPTWVSRPNLTWVSRPNLTVPISSTWVSPPDLPRPSTWVSHPNLIEMDVPSRSSSWVSRPTPSNPPGLHPDLLIAIDLGVPFQAFQGARFGCPVPRPGPTAPVRCRSHRANSA